MIAWNHGSVPEIVEEGVTGFVVASEAEAVAALARIDGLDRALGAPPLRRALHRRAHGPRLLALYQRLRAA